VKHGYQGSGLDFDTRAVQNVEPVPHAGRALWTFHVFTQLHSTFLNFALANWNLPAIIWCFAGPVRFGDDPKRCLCVWQCDIAPSLSRLHSILSRVTVRRNPEEPFLLAKYGSGAATPVKKFFHHFEGVSCTVGPPSISDIDIKNGKRRKTNRKAKEE
jgi:hypothetical protein